MKEIRISPAAQLAVLGTIAAVMLGVLAASLPELRRYLKIESM
jgi:hypothetical protein